MNPCILHRFLCRQLFSFGSGGKQTFFFLFFISDLCFQPPEQRFFFCSYILESGKFLLFFRELFLKFGQFFVMWQLGFQQCDLLCETIPFRFLCLQCFPRLFGFLFVRIQCF